MWGIDEKTLVVFSSNNGVNLEFIESLGSTGGLRGYKRMLYKGGTLTPFFARWPRKIQGSVVGVITALLVARVGFAAGRTLQNEQDLAVVAYHKRHHIAVFPSEGR